MKTQDDIAVDNMQNERGFSLMEVLITLAIMSVLSLALFQSTSQLLSVSQKSIKLTNKTIDNFVLRETFKAVVQGLTPTWEEEDASSLFSGGMNAFSGLSSAVIGDVNISMERISVSVEPAQGGGPLYNLVFSTPQGSQILKNNLSVDSEFSYLGWDQQWYSAWPPEAIPSTGFFDDNLYARMPQLPIAIRLSDKSLTSPFVLIASYQQSAYPPVRVDDL